MPFKRIAMIARWKPVHLGQAAVLRALRGGAGQVIVGVGSSNRYNVRNPFTFEETEAMLRLVLDEINPTVETALYAVPDLDDGPRWRDLVLDLLGPLDLFVSANDYVRRLLQGVYPLAHPRDLVPRTRHVPIDGERVRRAMARGDPWEALVPPEVAAFLRERALPERFRREFGLRTLAAELSGQR